MTGPDLTIVIVTWNTEALTRRCLDSVRRCRDGCDDEVIVVDNASDDATVAIIRREFPQVTLIANHENRLYSEANNQGAAAAQGRYLCLLNSDAELRPGAVERMMAFLESHDDYAVVGPKLLNEDGSAQDSCNRFYTLLDGIFDTSMLGKFPPGSGYVRRSRMDDFDYATSRDVQQIMGACLMFRRDQYQEMDGFDPVLSLYFNDHDLCKRFLARGLKSRFLAEAEILHLRGESARQLVELNVHWTRNQIDYLHKYYGWIGRAVARGLHRLKAVKIFLKIHLGSRSKEDKRAALAELKDKMRKVLAPASADPRSSA